MADLSPIKAEFFKALAHPLRIRILDALRQGELGVNELCVRLGVEQSTVSQQLAILRTRDLVAGRKHGNMVFYSVKDPATFRLLDVAHDIFNNHLINIKDLLSQLETSATLEEVAPKGWHL
jgi:DNA-binding transcriptional ArsR family regulator